MPVAALIADFLEYLKLERNASQLTIKNYDHYLKQFLQFARDIKPSSIDLDLVRKYKLYLSKKPLKAVTQNFFLIALRSFLKFLADAGIQTLPAEEVTLKKQETRQVKVLMEEEIFKLLNAPDITKMMGLRDRAIMETLFSAGLRVSELASLNRNSVNAAGWVEKYLSMRKDNFKPLFIRYQGKVDPTNEGEAMRLTPRSIERVLEKYVKKLRLPVKATPQTLRYSSHLFPILAKSLRSDERTVATIAKTTAPRIAATHPSRVNPGTR